MIHVNPGPARFVYVDAFASSGIYAGEAHERQSGRAGPVHGSPVIGIEALDAMHVQPECGRPIQTYAILVERDPTCYAKLLETLRERGWADRILEHPDPITFVPGGIALFNMDFRDIWRQVYLFTDQQYLYSFYLLDPYGPDGIPLSMVGPIVLQKRTDCLINFITSRAIRAAGFLKDPSAAGGEYTLLGWTRVAAESDKDAQELLEEWGRRFPLDQGEDTPTEAVDWLLNQTRCAYERLDPNLVVKLMPLLYQNRERVMMHLFLTTSNVSGALALNETLSKAGAAEYLERQRFMLYQFERRGFDRSGTPSLFADQLDTFLTPRSADPNVDLDEVMARIRDRFAGQIVTFDDVRRQFVNSDLWPKHFVKAVKGLRAAGYCSFAADTPSPGTAIQFVSA